MEIGVRQRFITSIVSQVLEQEPQINMRFDWLKNKHSEEDFGKYYPVIQEIFATLGGKKEAMDVKRPVCLSPDAYFGGKWNMFFEFDEFQHFSTARLRTLELLTPDIETGFDKNGYKHFCNSHKEHADKYRRSKTTAEFNFSGGRTAQRAYLDCFRDLLPTLHGLYPTLRIAEFEVTNVLENNDKSISIVRSLVEEKLGRNIN